MVFSLQSWFHPTKSIEYHSELHPWLYLSSLSLWGLLQCMNNKEQSWYILIGSRFCSINYKRYLRVTHGPSWQFIGCSYHFQEWKWGYLIRLLIRIKWDWLVLPSYSEWSFGSTDGTWDKLGCTLKSMGYKVG